MGKCEHRSSVSELAENENKGDYTHEAIVTTGLRSRIKYTIAIVRNTKRSVFIVLFGLIFVRCNRHHIIKPSQPHNETTGSVSPAVLNFYPPKTRAHPCTKGLVTPTILFTSSRKLGESTSSSVKLQLTAKERHLRRSMSLRVIRVRKRVEVHVYVQRTE
jgi:hypothetical protein